MKTGAIYVAICAALWALYGIVTFTLILGYSGFAGYVVVWAIQGAVAGSGTLLLAPVVRRLIKKSALAEYIAAWFIGMLLGFCLTMMNLSTLIFSTAQLSTQVTHSMTLAIIKAVVAYSLISAGMAVIASRR